MNTMDEYIPRPGEFDPLPEEAPPVDPPSGVTDSIAAATPKSEASPCLPLIQFRKPSELLNYIEPEGQNLAGSYHLERGAPTVLAGPPGAGKSRATLWLAMLGAAGSGSWFGLPIHTRFRTLIVQSENSESRLHRDMKALPDAAALDDWVRISVFPAFRGFQFANQAFRDELRQSMRSFKPDLVILDPWNNVTRDSMEKDFQDGMDHVRDVLSECPQAALLILHHLRKPRNDDRHKGRNLAHLLSGSYVLVSIARSVLVMQPASDNTEDDRVILTPAKNNNGELGPRTAWRRKAGWFEKVEEFDFEAFDNGSSGPREKTITESHIIEAMGNGSARHKSKVVADLMKLTKCGRTAAYAAVKLPDGPFKHLLTEDAETGSIRLQTKPL